MKFPHGFGLTRPELAYTVPDWRWCPCHENISTVRIFPPKTFGIITRGDTSTKEPRAATAQRARKNDSTDDLEPPTNLQVHPDLVRPAGLDRHLRHAQLPVKRHGSHNRQRSTRTDVRLDGGHRHHSLSIPWMPADRHVYRGSVPRVPHANGEVRLRYLRRKERRRVSLREGGDMFVCERGHAWARVFLKTRHDRGAHVAEIEVPAARGTLICRRRQPQQPQKYDTFKKRGNRPRQTWWKRYLSEVLPPHEQQTAKTTSPSAPRTARPASPAS